MILAFMYVVIFTPVALVFRMAGRDVMSRKLDPEAETYWIESAEPRPPDGYYKQF